MIAFSSGTNSVMQSVGEIFFSGMSSWTALDLGIGQILGQIYEANIFGLSLWYFQLFMKLEENAY